MSGFLAYFCSLQVKILCDKAKEILVDESNVQVGFHAVFLIEFVVVHRLHMSFLCV